VKLWSDLQELPQLLGQLFESEGEAVFANSLDVRPAKRTAAHLKSQGIDGVVIVVK
jgi:hypothetical protein